MDLNIADRIKEIVTYINNIDLIIKEYNYMRSINCVKENTSLIEMLLCQRKAYIKECINLIAQLI